MSQLLPVLILPAFVLFWCALSFLIVLVSGWRGLATRFRAGHTPQGRKFVLQRALINSTRFNGALTFIVGPEGLYLKLLPIFSVFGLAAPALLIPWSEMGAMRGGRWTWFETWAVNVAEGTPQRVTITFLDKKVAEAVYEFLAVRSNR